LALPRTNNPMRSTPGPGHATLAAVARVVLENLRKNFRSAGREIEAVRNLNLAIADKELFVLVGPSGSGKTTTLRLIAGLDKPTQGAIHVDGEPVNHLPPEDRQVGMVFQSPALYPHLNVWDNLAFGLQLRKTQEQEIERRVDEIAKWFGLDALLERMPEQLSGGERQRIALGRALALRPKIFLLDEPLSNLDPPLRAQLRREIRALQQRLACTMIYVTHDQAEAMSLADRIAVLCEGNVRQVGSPRDIYQKPADLFVAKFFGSPAMNLIAGQLSFAQGSMVFHASNAGAPNRSDPHAATMESAQENSTAFSIALPSEGTIALKHFIGKAVLLGLRPEHLVLAQGSLALPSVEAIVAATEFGGAHSHCHVSLTGGQRATLETSASGVFAPGDRICLSWCWEHVSFFDTDSGAAICHGLGK
jgi:multiple sugar transport system ATP-binding protein